MRYIQVNFDGLSGPTHFYGGLSYGNIASMTHERARSNPRGAALQGLAKMRFMMEAGVPQGIFPFHLRPALPYLRTLGYCGSDEEILTQVDPHLLALFSSASSMWTANAATTTPSCDSRDGKLHFTVANLASEAHRFIEANTTYTLLKQIFPMATIHKPLPHIFGDEGAANHLLLDHTHLFVYGRSLFDKERGHFPARQCKEASEAIIRRHGVKEARLLKQSRRAIDAGVFHNDVISMGYHKLFIYHEDAFEEEINLEGIRSVKVTRDQLSLEQAVKSYLFNSQFINEKTLLAPKECEKLDLSFLPLEKIHFVDLHQSMQNGGGPACLRLRVWLTQEELQQIHQGVLLTPALYEELVKFVKSHYRESLSPSELSSVSLLRECQEAHHALLQILRLS